MNKTTKIVIAVVAIIAVFALIALVAMNSKPKTNLDPIASAEDLTALVDKVYEGLDVEMPMVETQVIGITDNDEVKYATGLENADDVEYVVESKPMMIAQPYSFVLVKVKDGVNVEEVAKKMNENIDERKWVCVLPEKVYTTTSGDVICLVMAREEIGKPVYENFKTIAGTIGEEYVRTVEDGQLPDDMLPTDDGVALPGADELPAYDGEELPAEDQLPAADPETNTTDSVE